VAVILLAAPRAARANAAAAEFTTPEATAGVMLASATAIAVEHEELAIRCDGPRGAPPSCRFTAKYHLQNPTTGEHAALGAFYGGRDVTVALDGRDVRTTLSTDQLVRLDQMILNRPAPTVTSTASHGGAPLEIPPPRRLRLTSAAFEVKLGAGARATLVF